jgi:hypothetical protein
VLLDAPDPGGQAPVVDLAYDDAMAGLRGNLRDPVTHQAAADHADSLE